MIYLVTVIISENLGSEWWLTQMLRTVSHNSQIMIEFDINFWFGYFEYMLIVVLVSGMAAQVLQSS